MGSAYKSAQDVVDYMNLIDEHPGEKVGVMAVRLFRPWTNDKFLSSLPASVTKVAVMDKTLEGGSLGGPL